MRLIFVILLVMLTVGVFGSPADVLVSQEPARSVSLNGSWKFKYFPALTAGADEGFTAPDFDVSRWNDIDVPGHWELQGFAEPQYADDVREGTGLYRHSFRINPKWRGKRVFLRFDGVLYGFKAYLNGKFIGEWGSSFNQSTFDISDALKNDGSDNVLAVRVTTRNKGWDFDTMDCWSLSGIFRDVTLFSTPPVHFKDYSTKTTPKEDGTVELKVDVKTGGGERAVFRLFSPRGEKVGEIAADIRDNNAAAVLKVVKPELWNAEKPALYRLELELVDQGRIVETFRDRVGLRYVTTDGGILKLNGVPIKLRGINHHDIWPEGKVATEAGMRRDLELIKAANINFIRTAHYPPHPRLLEICDELGIYVVDEIPYIHGRKNLTNPDYQDVLFQRARATVMRDKNRASVILWSSGNENPFTELGNNTVRYVTELDATRPTMLPTVGSYFRQNYQKYPEFVEIIAPHYPNVERINEYGNMFQRPIIFTEYAHQRGLTRAGSSVQDQWEAMYRLPRVAGGAIWMFQDQGILRTANSFAEVKDADLKVWLDEKRYFDTNGYAGMDGIVYSDRTPQVDYWLVRKVYSPIQITERELVVNGGRQDLKFEVENRFDFRSLIGMKLRWEVKKNGAVIARGEKGLTAAPKLTETISLTTLLPSNLLSDIYSLEIACFDEKSRQIYERSLRLVTPSSRGNSRAIEIEADLPRSEPTLEVAPATISVVTGDVKLSVDRKNGRASLAKLNGMVMIDGFGPHAGGNPTINDIGRNREIEPLIWAGRLMTDAVALKTDARKISDGIEVSVSGDYPRTNKAGEFIRGGYTVLIRPSGAMEFRYEYVPVNATGEMLQLGFATAVSPMLSQFRWIGIGPYPTYPGKDRHGEFGIYHLDRDDLYFPGNRREVELATVTTRDGAGFVISGNQMTLDFERQQLRTVLAHVALTPGVLTKETNDVNRSSRLKAEAVNRFGGSFTLLPLPKVWPPKLAAWFGPQSRRVSFKMPFRRSFDHSNDRLEAK